MRDRQAIALRAAALAVVLSGLLTVGGCARSSGEETGGRLAGDDPAVVTASSSPEASGWPTPGAAATSGAAASPDPSPPPPPAGRPAFVGTSSRIDAATRAAMLASGSWRRGDPVAIADLRLLTLSYWGFDHRAHTGHLIVNARVAGDVLRAMKKIYQARFPIRRMKLIDAYGADDDRSMAADNTSAYNGRKVMGSTVWSRHAYGLAIDINPLENPEVLDGKVYPPKGERYVDRRRRAPGMIHRGDVVVRAFAAIGWEWGGDWLSPRDYQHFSASGD